jgi:hypothetical protein
MFLERISRVVSELDNSDFHWLNQVLSQHLSANHSHFVGKTNLTNALCSDQSEETHCSVGVRDAHFHAPTVRFF